jgi:N-acetyl-gamma-glutamyl-phosphate reductase
VSEPFVSVVDADQLPDTAHVRGSNRAHVGAWLDKRTGRVIAMGAIDNLVKGASGQAVQCMNIALGLPETAGLEASPIFP